MAEKKDVKRYKCTNYGACAKADGNQTIEIDAIETLGGTPECPGCHQHTLEEIVKKPFPTKLIGIIVAALVIIGGAVGAFLALGGGPKIDKVKLSEKSISLVLEETPKAMLAATALDKDGNEVKDANVVYVWSIDDEDVAKVSQSGEVTALKKGNASITVKIQGDEQHSATCQVEVKEPVVIEDTTPSYVAVESLSLEENFTLKEGASKKITMAIAPQNHEEKVAFKSSDENVATVSETGEVKALKAGTATITATTDMSGKQASVEVTVEKKSTGGEGGKNPRWGKYTGPRNAQGLPHGNGVLEITGKTTINGETTQPGERIEGVFRNGYVNMGSWFKKDGNVVVVKDLKAY